MKYKTCSVCGEIFPATTKYFYRRKDRKSGLRSECKTCVRTASINWGKRNPYKKKIKAKRYNDKISRNLLQAYVKRVLKNSLKVSAKELKVLPDEIIQVKRNQLKLQRCLH